MIHRNNRNRCQYCRFRKCLDVGMSKDSVRYGRVPKRSREKIEDVPLKPEKKPDLIEIPVQNLQYKKIMYGLIVSLCEAYKSCSSYTQERLSGLVRKPAMFNMTEQQHNAVDGQLGSGSLELQKIIMWQQLAAFLAPYIQQVVEFAKQVPGFSDLVQDDKLLCIKLGFFEVWLVQAARLINPMDNTITFTDGSYISREHLEIMFDREFATLIFNFVCTFNDLRLTDSEIALYSASVLLSAERAGITKHKEIQQIQEQLMGALRIQVNEAHPTELHVYPTLVSKLPELRHIGEKHLEHLRWFRANWAHLRLTPLFAEVYDIPKSDHEASQPKNEMR